MLQTVVDHCGYFMHANAGWFGRMPNVRIFRNSHFPQLMEWKEYAPGLPDTQAEGLTVQLLLPEDPACTLYSWLMKPLTRYLDSQKDQLNYRLSSCRMAVESSLGLLKVFLKVPEDTYACQ